MKFHLQSHKEYSSKYTIRNLIKIPGMLLCLNFPKCPASVHLNLENLYIINFSKRINHSIIPSSSLLLFKTIFTLDHLTVLISALDSLNPKKTIIFMNPNFLELSLPKEEELIFKQKISKIRKIIKINNHILIVVT